MACNAELSFQGAWRWNRRTTSIFTSGSGPVRVFLFPSSPCFSIVQLQNVITWVSTWLLRNILVRGTLPEAVVVKDEQPERGAMGKYATLWPCTQTSEALKALATYAPLCSHLSNYPELWTLVVIIQIRVNIALLLSLELSIDEGTLAVFREGGGRGAFWSTILSVILSAVQTWKVICSHDDRWRGIWFLGQEAQLHYGDRNSSLYLGMYKWDC